jgi:septal ring factor EnvC (AmiA/AmiB activator)
MTRLWIRKSTTRDLVRADYDPQARRTGRLLTWMLALALAALIALGSFHALRYSADLHARQQLETSQQENQRLQDTLAQNTVKMQQDQAARLELERELAKSSATIKQLQDKLTFYQQQTKK